MAEEQQTAKAQLDTDMSACTSKTYRDVFQMCVIVLVVRTT